jgi:molybdate transport system ATP-binding protein
MSVLRFDCRFRYPSGFSLDFAFETGLGITALIGPSGSGKTTILNLIAGLLRPNSGRIELHQKGLYCSRENINLPPEARRVGYVFQDYQLFPHLSVEQNLRYGDCRAKSEHFSFSRTVEILDLHELLHRRPMSLSGGQKQRIAIGRAILRGASILLLDEPFSALDAELRRSISEYLARAIAEFQIPTLLVSHDMETVNGIASATIRLARRGLEEGYEVASGKTPDKRDS